MDLYAHSDQSTDIVTILGVNSLTFFKTLQLGKPTARHPPPITAKRCDAQEYSGPA